MSCTTARVCNVTFISTCPEQDFKRHYVKYKSMQGSRLLCSGLGLHGLPIEHQVLKNLAEKRDHGRIEIRKLAASMPKNLSRSSEMSSNGSACSATGTIRTLP